MTQYSCVGNYLTSRLEQLGITHIFSVPGDYTSELLEIIDQDSPIKRIGNCNELNAGYAADGYARTHGLGAVCVTSGVGAFSLLNAVAGSYAEMIPVVVIIGTLSNSSRLKEVNGAERYHHQVSVSNKNRAVYENVVVCYEMISNPLMAPKQVDRALTDCISQSRPVVIEITEDCYGMPCPAPEGFLRQVPPYTALSRLREMEKDNKHALQIVKSVETAAKSAYEKLKNSKSPLFWMGHEISRYRLQDKALQLLELTGIPFVSSLLGKAVLAEDTRGFLGVYEGVFTSPFARPYVESSDCICALGVWNTDINTLGIDTHESGNPAQVFASRNAVKIGLDLYVQVSLENFMDSLIQYIKEDPIHLEKSVEQPIEFPAPLKGIITYDGFMSAFNRHLSSNHLVVADIGISANGASAFLNINRQEGYHIQGLWASIGWSVPAGLGASFVNGSRTFVIVGDGAFKLTCQEIATMVHYGCNTVVFVMNNGVYAVEQMFLDPAPFRSQSSPFEAANVLQRWDYKGLMDGFSNEGKAGAKSARVNTMEELTQTFAQIDLHQDSCWLVDIHLDERDYPAAWNAIVNKKTDKKSD